MHPSSYKSLLWKCLLFSGLFHILAVFFSEGYHRPDEHLIFIRFAALKMGWLVPQDVSRWEWENQIRPMLQPFLYSMYFKFCGLLGITNFFSMATGLRFLSSLLGFCATFGFIHFNREHFKTQNGLKVALIGAALLWPLPFFHARTSNENLATSVLLLAMIPLIKLFRSDKLYSYGQHFAIGLLLGCAYLLRFQLSVIIFFVLMWLLLIHRYNFKRWFVIGLGIVATIALGSLLDRWGYGNWTFTSWNYFKFGIIDNEPAKQSSAPFYAYVVDILKSGIFPVSLLLLIPPLYFCLKKPKHWLTWTLLPFFVVHSLLAHKELRYLFVLLPFIPFVWGLVAELILRKTWWGPFSQSKTYRYGSRVLLGVNLVALCIVSVKPAHSLITFYRHVYHMPEKVQFIYALDPFEDVLQLYTRNKLQVWPKSGKIYMFPNMRRTLSYRLQAATEPLWILANKFAQKDFLQTTASCSEEYSMYPSWVYKFNIGNWVQRSKTWSLFKCTP